MKKLIILLCFCFLLPFSLAEEIQRVDRDGYLYFMDYTGDYYSTQVMDSLRRAGYVTNFYLGFDDMEDYYKNGTLREESVAMVDKNGKPLYHFGGFYSLRC